MKIFTDCFGRTVRLTDERLAHILEHPEMSGMESEIQVALIKPRFVRPSRSDSHVHRFYNFCSETIVGGKWLCVVVKIRRS